MLIDCGKHVFWKADKATEVKRLCGVDKVDTPTVVLKHDETKVISAYCGMLIF